MNRLQGTTLVALILCLCLGTLASFAAEGVVNLNTASAEQLRNLPRVGPAIADRIIEFRKDNGPFKAIEELMLVRGIGEKTLELMKPYLSISGETTLSEKVRGTRPAKDPESSDS